MNEVIKQLGSMNMSKSHLTGWFVNHEPSLEEILTHNISPTMFKSRRKGVVHDGFYHFFVLDWDGDKKGFKLVICSL